MERSTNRPEKIDRYELMLRQAIRECPVPSKENPASNPFEAMELQIPFLADILYRLSVEHGIEWNVFRSDVLDLLTHERTVNVAAKGSVKTRPFAADLKDTHALIVLALDAMPPDPEGRPGE